MTIAQLLDIWRHVVDLLLLLGGHDPDYWV